MKSYYGTGEFFLKCTEKFYIDLQNEHQPDPSQMTIIHKDFTCFQLIMQIYYIGICLWI